jgi:hypothetical protein
MLAQTLRPIGAALDPDRVRRAAADIQPPDPRQLARALSVVPDRLDDVISDAGDAIREAAQHLPVSLPVARPRRRGPGAAQIALVLGGLVAIGVAAVLAFRLRAQAVAQAEEARLEEAALERAAGEGMDGTIPALGAEGVQPVPVPMDRPAGDHTGTPDNRAFDDIVARPTVGMGLGADR